MDDLLCLPNFPFTNADVSWVSPPLFDHCALGIYEADHLFFLVQAFSDQKFPHLDHEFLVPLMP